MPTPRGSCRLWALALAALAAAAIASPAAATTYLPGVDVSNWQGSIDWPRVARSGYRFVFAKATEGRTFVDSTYGTNRVEAEDAGLVIGAYHFARPDGSTVAAATADAVAEADHFLVVAGPRAGELPPALDLETTGGLPVSRLQAWTWAWLDEVRARLGVRPVIYTSPAFWQSALGDTAAFADAGYKLLWIAHWTSASQPWVPAHDWGGAGWTFWQWTDCGSVPGISGCVDRDRYNGNDLAPVENPPGAGVQLSFASNRAGSWSVFSRLAVVGAGAHELTPDARPAQRPSWSPDGTTLAFASKASGTWEVYTQAGDGRAPAVSLTGDAAWATDPAWSPDGTKIAFAEKRAGRFVVAVADVQTGTTSIVVRGPGDARSPTWSPDGTTLAFATNAGGNWDIARVDVASRVVTSLTTTASNDTQPAWSPDGRSIAFVSDRSGGGDIYLRNAAPGGRISRLTTNAAADATPAWAPDGSLLAFTSKRAGNWDVYLHGVASRWAVRLTTGASDDRQPAWRPGG